MWPNTQFPVDLAIFTEEIVNGKLHFFAALQEFRAQSAMAKVFVKYVKNFKDFENVKYVYFTVICLFTHHTKIS